MQLNDQEPFCNFARPTHLLRWKKEKMEKNYSWSFSVPLRPTRAGSSYREWHDASNAAMESYQRPPRGAAYVIFFNYKNIKTPMIPEDNSEKTKVKNLKCPLTLHKRK
jgi:hypothetical protein